MKEMFTVVGFFPESEQTYVRAFTAKSGYDARCQAEEYEIEFGRYDLEVIAVFKGDLGNLKDSMED